METVKRQHTSQPDGMYRKMQEWVCVPQLTMEETAMIYTYKHPDKPPMTRGLVSHLEREAFDKIAAAIYGEGW